MMLRDPLHSPLGPRPATAAPTGDLARLLANAYLRHLRQKSANHQSQADLRSPDSPELTGYVPPPE